jgi:putative peptidoglycan lipid II flippase
VTAPSRTLRAAAGIGAITAASRLLGFVRVLVVAAVLGTTYLGNGFQAANSTSNILFELVAAGALSAVLVPAFVRLLDEDDQQGAEAVAGGVLGLAIVVLGGVALVGMVAAPWLAQLLTVGVPAEVADAQRDLVAFLLVLFLPQVVLYAAGTVATGALHAQRRFLAPAAAPIANTVVMVTCLLVFRELRDGGTGLDLTAGERWLLAAAGTGGVLAFTGVLVAACAASGFRLRPRLRGRDPRVAAVLRHAGWGVVLHTSAGVLLGGAVLAGAAVEGGVVAYQVAWVFFLAPYAIFAQPIHTAVLPELVGEAGDPSSDRFRRSARWALERLAVPILPISALLVALAGPGMRLVSFGEAATGDGPELLAAALASLAIGLLPYAAFLLLARESYALGDARTPGLVALASAAIGAVLMLVGALVTDGVARIATIGAAHSVAQLIAAIVLAAVLRQRVGGPVVSAVVALLAAVSVVAGLAAWAASQAAAGVLEGRAGDLVSVLAGVAAAAAVLGVAELTIGLRRRLSPRTLPAAEASGALAAPDAGIVR